MNELTDQELLSAYAQGQSQAAFGELVRRHVDLVYSAALRMVRGASQAQDVTQDVFVALGQNAARLAGHPVLSGWLHRTAQNIAAKTVRTEIRRRAREQQAATMNQPRSTHSDPIWEQIAPHLDSALGALRAADREAVLLRYFEKKSVRDIAAMIGISTDAAQKRVSRGLEQLRVILAKRGVAVGVGGLVAGLSANAVQAAPAGLALTLSTTAAVTAPASISIVTATIITMTTTKTIIGAVCIAAAIGISVYETRKSDERTAASPSATAPWGSWDAGRDPDPAATRPDHPMGRWPRTFASGKPERIPTRAEAEELWEAKVPELVAKLNEHPELRIPELSLLPQHAWAIMAGSDFTTDETFRATCSDMRMWAKQELSDRLRKALRGYTGANDGMLPTRMEDLAPYFSAPLDPAILDRYQLLQTGKLADLPEDADLIREQADPADADHDVTITLARKTTRQHLVELKHGQRVEMDLPYPNGRQAAAEHDDDL